MWNNLHPVYSAGIRTPTLGLESPPITTRPGLLPIITEYFVYLMVNQTHSEVWLR